jgi:hypothetical protein
MRMKAIGRVAAIALTGFLFAGAAPVNATDCSDNCATGKPVSLKSFAKRHLAHHYRRHLHRIESRHYHEDSAPNVADADALPAKVANARAQIATDGKPADVKRPDGNAGDPGIKPQGDESAARSAESKPAASDAELQVLSQDELNDLDRAAADPGASPAKLSPAVANSHAELREEPASAWAQTSTIGKAFITFGVMLTLASAARMFMA